MLVAQLLSASYMGLQLIAEEKLREARQNLCFLARERARERERKRTRNKNLKFFGYVHVYEHEHVHVVISKVRLWGRFAALP